MRGLLIPLLLAAAACTAKQPPAQPFSERPPSLRTAEVALDSGQPAIAASVAQTQLSINPNNIAAVLVRAKAEAAMGEDVAAEADFNRVLAAEPASAEASLGLARMRIQSDPAAAEALLVNVVVHGTPNASVWNNLGVALDVQGRHKEAQDAYRKAIAADPLMKSAQANLARSLSLSGGP